MSLTQRTSQSCVGYLSTCWITWKSRLGWSFPTENEIPLILAEHHGEFHNNAKVMMQSIRERNYISQTLKNDATHQKSTRPPYNTSGTTGWHESVSDIDTNYFTNTISEPIFLIVWSLVPTTVECSNWMPSIRCLSNYPRKHTFYKIRASWIVRFFRIWEDHHQPSTLWYPNTVSTSNNQNNGCSFFVRFSLTWIDIGHYASIMLLFP